MENPEENANSIHSITREEKFVFEFSRHETAGIFL